MSSIRGERLVLAIVGRRNAGKSSLINAMTGQQTAIVDDTPGTTTDPVNKTYELLPLGPVTLIDTAGIDDTGKLGDKRVTATRKALWRADVAVVVIPHDGLSPIDRDFIAEIRRLEIPLLVAFNKADLAAPAQADLDWCQSEGLPCMAVSSATGANITELKESIGKLLPPDYLHEKVLVGDLVQPGDVAVLVAPIDLAAPKGRLILPQVQVLRELLDNDAVGMIVKERELEAALGSLAAPPALVVTDSQVVLKVDGDVPPDVPMTTFSILFARYKGDLDILVDGARAIDRLRDGDRVLIAEACSHHVQADDIGRVKIPRWLRQYVGVELAFDVAAGYDFPDNLEDYALVIHCGGCMLTRMEMIRRMRECKRRGVPITNYGVAISKVQGVLERTIKPLYK